MWYNHYKMKYLLSFDVATKLGWCLYQNDTNQPKIIQSGAFDFCGKGYKAVFSKHKALDGQYYKIKFIQQEMNLLLGQIFEHIVDCEELKVICEYSVFGFKFNIVAVTRIFDLLCVALSQIETLPTYSNSKFFLKTVMPQQWRKIFTKQNKTLVKKHTRDRKVNWKAIAREYCQIKQIIIQNNNHDEAEAILIGECYLSSPNQSSVV